ncbi:hypothetical protein N7492_006279 [Penicillium capsulatum]|uniref:Uncharacterized protein n=1 Tax=Penicillium capsulatum TaxID=69766 RepID=A0A9W9LMT8_9EURO|nr:hypothetical protein N7492_006279 [Penicillium capsulatum]
MTYPPYTPATLGRELGIMFAFVGACAVTMAVYSFFWRVPPLISPGHQRRQNDQDRAHRRAFQARAGAALFERAADPDSGGCTWG